MFVLTYEWDNGYRCSCCRKYESRYEEFDTLEELFDSVRSDSEDCKRRKEGFQVTGIYKKEPAISQEEFDALVKETVCG